MLNFAIIYVRMIVTRLFWKFGGFMGNIPIINVGDILEMKKPHPCGSKEFKVLRVGADIKISCTSCARALTLDRIKVEKMIKKIHSGGENG